MDKYQEALNNVKRVYVESDYYDEEDIKLLQELVDRENPLTPTYKNTYIEHKEHYLDKDYEMKYHCPKCDSIVYPIGRCSKCHQNLDWNKYYIIEEKDGHTFYRDRGD
jgi:predicted RNA-binding Zn-ribbon protein involved in translation (DUF1610 family)